jgi:hypothetical protein
MKKKPWIVLVSLDPLPHESCKDSYTRRSGEVKGPHYSAGARTYTPGWGSGAEGRRLHVERQAELWRNLGYRMEILVEHR